MFCKSATILLAKFLPYMKQIKKTNKKHRNYGFVTVTQTALTVVHLNHVKVGSLMCDKFVSFRKTEDWHMHEDSNTVNNESLEYLRSNKCCEFV